MGRVRSLHSACPAQPHDRVLVELWICGVCGGVRVGQPHGPASPSLVLTNYLSVAWPLCTRCPPLPPPPSLSSLTCGLRTRCASSTRTMLTCSVCGVEGWALGAGGQNQGLGPSPCQADCSLHTHPQPGLPIMHGSVSGGQRGREVT